MDLKSKYKEHLTHVEYLKDIGEEINDEEILSFDEFQDGYDDKEYEGEVSKKLMGEI